MTISRSVTTLPIREGQICSEVWEGDRLDIVKMGYFSSMEIYNFTDIPYIVRDRMGIPQVVRSQAQLTPKRINTPRHKDVDHTPSGACKSAGIHVIYSFSFHKKDVEQVRDVLERYSAYSVVYRKLLRAVEEASLEFIPYGSMYTVAMSILLTPRDLADHESIYIQELGIVISTEKADRLIDHPESLADIQRIRCNNILYNINVEDDPAHISLKAFTTSKHKLYDHLYVSLLGGVQEIPIIYDPEGGFDGVEVYSKATVANEGGFSKPLLQRFTFDEAFQTLGVATSIHAAGNILEKAKQSREILANELADKKMEFEQQLLVYKEREEAKKREYEERVLVLKKECLEREADIRLLNERQAKLKADHELAITHLRATQDNVKSFFSLSSVILGMVSQVIRLIPPTK